MCYYQSIVFACGDWKWGQFREKCINEWRTGETCGTKLVYERVADAETCTLCKAIERKKGRYKKAYSDWLRFKDDPKKPALAKDALELCNQLTTEIERLTMERSAKYMNVGSNRRTAPR